MTNPAGVAPEPTGNPVEDAIGAAWKTTMVEQGVKEEELARDEHGRFRPRDTEELPEAPAEDKGPAEGEKAAEPAAKEGKPGEVALKAADPKTLATSFTLKDAEGELDIPEGLTIEFQANGKTRSEPLDRVVKFAQMGVYNHEREQRVQQTEARAQEVETYAQRLEATVQEREQQLEAMLRDPDFRERAIAEYEQQQTPERRAARLEREREEFRAEQERSRLAVQGEQYFTGQIVPSVDMLAKAVPNVTPEEITSRLAPFVNRLKGPLGIVPPDRYDAINQHFLTEIIPWAQQLDEHRALERGTMSGRQQVGEQTARDKAKDAAIDAERVRAQKARRLAAANLKPVGKGASPTPTKGKAPTSHADIMEDVIASTLAGMS